MARKKKELPLLEQVEITGVAAEGKALARVNDLVVFVPFAAPGDIVDLQLIRKKHNYAEARIVKFHAYSSLRVNPFCEHFGVCGGCKWQHVAYDYQLQFKRQQVEDNLTRIGKIPLPEILPTKGSTKQQYYRNKLEFSFSNKSWLTYEQLQTEQEFDCRNALGFHIPGMFDKVLDIKKCWLQDDISNRIRLSIRQYAIDNHYPFFDLREQTGFMRNIIIRTSSTGEVMLIVVFFEPDMVRIERMMQHIADTFPEITSLLYIVNQKRNDTIADQEVCVFRGRDYIWESMEGLRFKIGPKSFYQTNSEQAYELYPIEYDKEHARINGLDNTLFYAGDMKDILTEDFIEEHGRPEVIITDPPRAGMHDDVIKTILFASPERIVYVSCNPATQARDLSLLDAKYKVERVQPVDMFPHTHHVENVVLLVRKE